jgi:hypothetical protein
MENPLAQFYLFVIVLFGTAGLLTFFPAAAAPFFSIMWQAILGITLCAMVVLLLLFIVRP